jgi:hypothetical protein
LGHQPELRSQRDPGLLRTPLLVRLAGHYPRPRASVDGRRKGDQGAHRTVLARRWHLRFRLVRESPWRRPLLERNDAQSSSRSKRTTRTTSV